MDLEITGTGWCLLIENKINHWDANPFTDYEGHAKGLGKQTTLFSILSGFQTPSTGQVICGGERMHGLPPHEICHRGIARTFQIAQSFPSLTVYDTVLTAALVRHRLDAAQALAQAVLLRTGLWTRRAALGADITLAEQRRLGTPKRP